jgi:hypothetical protein
MTGQADVKWIWMAVALVVVAVPTLTVLFNREIRAMQQRVAELERRIDALATADRSAGRGADRAAEIAEIERRLATTQRERELDILRTLSAMRPPEPEFIEEYFIEPARSEAAGRD